MQFQIIPVTAFQENCSIIWCEKTMAGAIVDPGGEFELLVKAVEKLNVKEDIKPKEMEEEILSHSIAKSTITALYERK